MSSYTVYVASLTRKAIPTSFNDTLGAPDGTLFFTISASIMVMIVTLIAIVSVARKSPPGLYLVALAMSIISIAKLISGFFIYRLQADIINVTMVSLKMAIDYYGHSESTLVDDMQTMFSCCGVYDASIDWERYFIKHNNTYPGSCCTNLTPANLCLIPDKSPCLPIISEVLRMALKQISLVAIFNSILQMVIVFLSLSLARMFNAMKLTQN